MKKKKYYVILKKDNLVQVTAQQFQQFKQQIDNMNPAAITKDADKLNAYVDTVMGSAKSSVGNYKRQLDDKKQPDLSAHSIDTLKSIIQDAKDLKKQIGFICDQYALIGRLFPLNPEHNEENEDDTSDNNVIHVSGDASADN